MILNTLNNKCYVGSTNNFSVRRKRHYSLLKKNIHENKYLQHSYNKYGEAFLVFIVLEHCEVSELIDRELHWMYVKQSHDKSKGYNMGVPKQGDLIKVTEEYREEKRREGFARVYKDQEITYEEWKAKKKAIADSKRKQHVLGIVRIDCIKNTVTFFSSLHECITLNNYSKHEKRSIQKVLCTTGKERKRSYRGCIYLYKENYDVNKEYKLSDISLRSHLLQVK